MKPIVNGSVELNTPSNFDFEGQAFLNRVEEIKAQVFETFLASLPSNYVSKTLGPNYTLQYEIVAEQVAKYHVILEVFYEQTFYDGVSSDMLLSELGRAVFPDLSREPLTIEGDVSYRSFLQKMVGLLLRGSKIDVIREGVNLLTEAQVDVIESYLHNPAKSEQFNLLLEVHNADYNAFPDNPVATQDNIGVVLKALKPAHVIYEYRHVFKEILENLVASAQESIVFEGYHYEEARHNFRAFHSITGTSGWFVRNDVFRATTSDLINVEPNISKLVVGGKQYTITNVFSFIDDSTPRAYVTSPTGIVGNGGTFAGGVFTDASEDFKGLAQGETLEVTEGLNTGVYAINVIVDNGALGTHDPNKVGAYSSLKVEPLFLQLKESASGVILNERQDYEIILNPNGRAQSFNIIEDVTETFINNRVRSNKVPLVSRQGDSALAKIKDVVVRVDGEPVEIISVSPLEGVVSLSLSEPLGADSVVTLDYFYAYKINQKYELLSLNKGGFNLNQKATLNAGTRAPLQKKTAHRYLGFEGAYSSTLGKLTLNSTLGFSVLNQYNVVSSGEYVKDITPEYAVLQSVNKEYLSLLDADMRADRIYRVLVGGVSQAFSFDKATQKITIPSLTGTSFEADVYFPPAKPITQTYLERQPLESSPHYLSEGTPPFNISNAIGGLKTQLSSEGVSDVLTIADDGGSASLFDVSFAYAESSSSLTPKEKPFSDRLFTLNGGAPSNHSFLSTNGTNLNVLSPIEPLERNHYLSLHLNVVFVDAVAGVEAPLEENDVGGASEESVQAYVTQLGAYPRLNTFNALNLNLNLQGGAPLDSDHDTPLEL